MSGASLWVTPAPLHSGGPTMYSAVPMILCSLLLGHTARCANDLPTLANGKLTTANWGSANGKDANGKCANWESLLYIVVSIIIYKCPLTLSKYKPSTDVMMGSPLVQPPILQPYRKEELCTYFLQELRCKVFLSIFVFFYILIYVWKYGQGKIDLTCLCCVSDSVVSF